MLIHSDINYNHYKDMKIRKLLRICYVFMVLVTSMTAKAQINYNWGSKTVELGATLDVLHQFTGISDKTKIKSIYWSVLSSGIEKSNGCFEIVRTQYDEMECRIRGIGLGQNLNLYCTMVYGSTIYQGHYVISVVNPQPTSVSLPSTMSVENRSTITLTPTILPTGAETTYSWSSSDRSVATVSSSGVVTGVSKGTATITVKTANGKTATCKVTVTAATPYSVSLPTSRTVELGETTKLSASVSPSYAEYTLTWSSDDESVATISSSGEVTAVGVGTAKINVRTNNWKTATCTVNVKISATSITLPEAVSVFEGETSVLQLVLQPENTTSIVKWVSSDNNVVTVTQEGAISGINAGTAKVTATTDNGLSAECEVTVKIVPPTELSLPESVTAIFGESIKLVPTIMPENAKTVLTWSSSDEKVATVTDDGTVTGKDIGQATIKVESDNGLSAECVVSVDFRDGDVFNVLTDEGASMQFKVISSEEKTCQVGAGDKKCINEDFSGGISIPSVVYGYNVVSMAQRAFSGCTGLTAITIPESVTNIGDYAFGGCTALTSITVSGGNKNYDSRDNCNAIIETASNTLVLGCKNTIIPNSVTSIGEYNYEIKGETNVEIIPVSA